MQVSITDSNSSNSLSISSSVNVNGTSIGYPLTVGSVAVNSSQITVGASSIMNSSVLTTPLLTLGGVGHPGLIYKGIVNYEVFTANGTWTNPSANATLGLTGDEQVFVMAWSGGGGGWANTNATDRPIQGGGGGGCIIGNFRVSGLPSTVTVTVGSGGTGGVGPSTPATSGGNTIFNGIFIGGGIAANPSNGFLGAGGGGPGASTGTGWGPLPGSTGSFSTFGGGLRASAGQNSRGGGSVFGGGGGGGSNTISATSNGGPTIYGGGGGGSGNSSNITTVGGTSVFGGNGGSTTLSTGSAGSIPGGGGGAGSTAAGNGARGEVRVWVIK